MVSPISIFSRKTVHTCACEHTISQLFYRAHLYTEPNPRSPLQDHRPRVKISCVGVQTPVLGHSQGAHTFRIRYFSSLHLFYRTIQYFLLAIKNVVPYSKLRNPDFTAIHISCFT